jgi:hypothetical protein
MYQLTPGQFEVVANTFAAEFPYNHLFMNHLRTRSPMLGLVARKTPGRESIDWDQIGARCDALRSQGGLHDPILRHRSGLRMLYLGRWNREPMAASQLTLDNPFLEYSAATVRLSERPQSRYFHPARWIRFCRTRHQRVAGDRLFRTELPEGLGALACGFLELDFARRREHRLAKSISRRIAMNLPTPLRDDREADWQRWPGAAVATMPTAEDASRLNRP